MPPAGKPAAGSPTDVITPDPAAAAAAAAARAKRKFEFDVDGEKVEREWDEDEVRNELQRSLGASKRMNEAVQAMKQVEQFVSMLKDPRQVFDVLRHPSIGMDPDQLVRDYVNRKLELERMDPREREAMELKEKYEVAQRELDEMKRGREAEEIQRKTAEHRDRILGEIQETIGQAGLPKSDYIVRRMAKAMMELREELGRPVKAAEVVDMIKRDYTSELRHMLGTTNESSMAEFMGEDNLARIRAYELKKAQEAGLNGAGAPAAHRVTESAREQPRRMITPSELEEEVRRRLA